MKQRRAAFVDYATVVIGLYAAAAGIPKAEILIVQDAVALAESGFGDVEKDPYLLFLPTRNVENADTGYEIFLSGRIGAVPDFEAGR